MAQGAGRREKSKAARWAALLGSLEAYFRLKKAFMPGYTFYKFRPISEEEAEDYDEEFYDS